ncbi:MAG: hypothetical protein F6K42_20420 [Leptolyngbya sp. SIO1D8]|nr:hypothetical protein [Leptolyngbya sp. SIO1D8]
MNKRSSLIFTIILCVTVVVTASLTTIINRLAIEEEDPQEPSIDSTEQIPADASSQSVGNNPSEALGSSNGTQVINDACESGSLAQEPGLEDDLLGFDGFYSYSWQLPENERPIYQNAVFVLSRGNNLCVYQTVQLDPFGSLALCGGLGCDLEKGELIAELEFTPNADGTLLVQSTTGLASFMRGAVCQVDASYLPTLVCRSPQSPNSQVQGDVIIFFAPAS